MQIRLFFAQSYARVCDMRAADFEARAKVLLGALLMVSPQRNLCLLACAKGLDCRYCEQLTQRSATAVSIQSDGSRDKATF
jgi:hypothetical protein